VQKGNGGNGKERERNKKNQTKRAMLINGGYFVHRQFAEKEFHN
jgi:hypothetical protein